MADPIPSDVPAGMHVCPPRVDGAPVLFAHTVTVPMCQQRQREHYHKCFTCAHNNAQARGRTGPAESAGALEKLAPLRRVGAG